jgi:lysophospholipase L1-like esterase
VLRMFITSFLEFLFNSPFYSAAQRVAAIGDSITLGECARRGFDYPSQLQQRLGDGFVVKV